MERPLGGSHFEKVQILKASMQRYGVENYENFHMDNDQYIPFSIVSVLYSEIRSAYPTILKNLIPLADNQKVEGESKINQRSLDNIMNRIADEEKFSTDVEKKCVSEAKSLIRYLVTPAININGPCFFNGKFEDKGKEEQGLGLLWDQFQEVFTQLTSSEVSALEGEILNFLDVCKSKDRKIIEKDLGGGNNRPGPPQMRNQNPRII